MFLISIIGPECTGKSTLAKQLATHYKGLFVEEYARTYLSIHHTYEYESIVSIAHSQLDLLATKQKEAKDGQLLFLDTDLYVLKIWSEYVYNRCDTFILDKLVDTPIHLYLLMDTDLPWIWDSQRELPKLKDRKEVWALYMADLIEQTKPFGVVSGLGDARIKKAIALIDQFFSTHDKKRKSEATVS